MMGMAPRYRSIEDSNIIAFVEATFKSAGKWWCKYYLVNMAAKERTVAIQRELSFFEANYIEYPY